ncbi:MAG: exodeoxyribonuclease VII small subunit [bacterium]|nr:exodeoxyribonuclease VII small subunit [bacterium]
MAAAKKTLEQSFHKLDEIVSQLEKEDISLEESFGLFNDGMKLLKECNDSIDKVEKKLVVLNEKQMSEGNK